MLILGINWNLGWVQITSGGRTYTCDMVERDDDFYFKFKNQWHPVSQYASERLDAEIKTHKQGVYQKRNCISQAEFETICEQVLSRHSNITRYRFEEPGILHVSYPSHSGRSTNGSTLYFGNSGYITYTGWTCQAGSNEGLFIGEEISRKIQSALYD